LQDAQLERDFYRLVLGQTGNGTLDPADIHAGWPFLPRFWFYISNKAAGRVVSFFPATHDEKRTSATEHCDGGPRMTTLFARQSSDEI
jgi:hypothetical protein